MITFGVIDVEYIQRDDSTENWSYKNNIPIEEVWGTYHYLAREIAPRLKTFKALDKHGWPEDFENQEDWNNTIQKMIDAFELVKNSCGSVLYLRKYL